jgi:hypothetical protein
MNTMLVALVRLSFLYALFRSSACSIYVWEKIRHFDVKSDRICALWISYVIAIRLCDRSCSSSSDSTLKIEASIIDSVRSEFCGFTGFPRGPSETFAKSRFVFFDYRRMLMM